jgi:hypothetical protein
MQKKAGRQQQGREAQDMCVMAVLLWFYFWHQLDGSSRSEPLWSHVLPELSYN